MVDKGFKSADDMRAMWNQWWYDRFDFGLDVPKGARRFEIELGGERWEGALLEDVAPRTCQGFWDALPIDGHAIHCAFFGRAAYWLDRIDFPGVTELENRTTRFFPGEFIWEPWLKEITFAYGRWAEVRFPTTPYFDGVPHPGQACLFARLTGNLTGFAQMCKRMRYEGALKLAARRMG